VSRIFISHSSIGNAPAIALRDWLVSKGWDDLFLDLDPERGIPAGERWKRALSCAASHCEAFRQQGMARLALVQERINLARRLNKRLFGVLIEEGAAIGELHGTSPAPGG
jgi:hypothetical protein